LTNKSIVFSDIAREELQSRVPENTKVLLGQTQLSHSSILCNLLSISGEYKSGGYYISGVCTLGLLQTEPATPSSGIFLIRKDDYHRLDTGRDGKICFARGWFRAATDAVPLSSPDIYIPSDTLNLYKDTSGASWDNNLLEFCAESELIATIQFRVLNVANMYSALFLKFEPVDGSDLGEPKMMCRMLRRPPRTEPMPWTDISWDKIEGSWSSDFKKSLKDLGQVASNAFSSNLRSCAVDSSLQALLLLLTFMWEDIMDCELFETFQKDGFDKAFAQICLEFLAELHDASEFSYQCQNGIMEECNCSP
jgi:hypothetical protein